jgi:hypothetical protein
VAIIPVPSLKDCPRRKLAGNRGSFEDMAAWQTCRCRSTATLSIMDVLVNLSGP